MELLSSQLWLHIRREARVSSRMSAAIAYVTDVSALSPRAGDTLVVNASDSALGAGSTDPHVLRGCLHAGMKLYSLPTLHAKAIAFENAAFIGSMNASESSQNRLIECAIMTREASVISETTALVEQLAESGIEISSEFLDRAVSIYVRPSSQRDTPSYSTSQRTLWYLENCPYTSPKNLRAYFLALVVTQIGDLKAGESFALWPNVKNMSQHLTRGRIEKVRSRYQLTSIGVDYFSSDEQWPEPRRLERFLHAVSTGDESALPEDLAARTLKPFPV